MRFDEIYENYQNILAELKRLASDTQQRALDDSADSFFRSNVNFLNKSFLIILCSYLESFLKDCAIQQVNLIKDRVDAAHLPQSLAHWEIKGDAPNLSKIDFAKFSIKTNSNSIDEMLSGSPHRTCLLYAIIGVKLQGNQEWESRKDQIQSIISKRNAIIHHNDSASDLSTVDVIGYVDLVDSYIHAIKNILISG